MDVGITGFDWLAETFQATELRVVVTVAAAGLLVAVLLTYRRLQAWISNRSRPLYGDIASTVVLIGTCVLSLAIVLGVWGQTDEIYELSDRLDLSGAVVAQAIVSFILIVGSFIVTRFVKRVLDEVLGSASAVTDHQREITHRVSQVIIWSVALVMILGIWVDDLGGLLVGAGFLGIVVGMAAQQVLGTVLAGFVLMFARPFEIGDWIEVEDNQGIVTDISIVNTRIRSFDGEYIMIPNDVISSSMVTNRSKRGRLRVEIDVGVDYDADIERAAELAEETVDDLEQSLSAPGPQVITKQLGDSSVVLGVRLWIDKPSARRYMQTQTAAINAIKEAFDEEGIGIPYPQRELSSRPDTEVPLAGVGATPDGTSSTDEENSGTEYQMTEPEDH
ncbi:mechanosensitive channel protein MscS [Natrialba magadii ATCC 43099]|uniref:Mechanosensitive channel protein MscS n=1 Tax=Natrialba magadii (strain ATCC 43099 / DSM 3394 / CCM 3739 / CIP 104546 / IAM 13178 / JCM 8861 / NBRC 102185 / NCIMB 2190 / MS3) TaxID=547559 RepID=D3SRH2_NATMM|nr:mechanosensitive ion channel family protein [Natrialba magadii]ADD04677.1 mechanosensitive channel protein MscS [Natrialba magadii ATCC 43099]ELY25333.1 mechanosensitive ion channel protein MscS [Natrialba magadii ATCC 43099]